MATFLSVGRRLIAPHHIAFVEPYRASDNQIVRTSKDFMSRVVLVNRDSLLIEDAPAAFAEANGFQMLPHDHVGLNPCVLFQIEEFVASEAYTPTKAYASRVIWRDLDGNEQSRLLLSAPKDVAAALAVADSAIRTPASWRRGRRLPGKARRARPSVRSHREEE